MQQSLQTEQRLIGVFKIQKTIDRYYEFTIVSLSAPTSEDTGLDHIPYNDKVSCEICKTVGQCYWQKLEGKKLQMYYYCPNCNVVWTVNVRDIKDNEVD